MSSDAADVWCSTSLQALMDGDGNGRVSQSELLTTAKSVAEVETYVRQQPAARMGGTNSSAASFPQARCACEGCVECVYCLGSCVA